MVPVPIKKKSFYSSENIANLSLHALHQKEKTRCIHTIEEDQTMLSLATNDCYLFSGSQGSKLFVWDLVTFQLVTVLNGHCGSILNLTVHQDWLFSCSGDGTVRVWDIKKLKCIYVIHSYYDVGDIFSVIYTKLSNLLVIGCQNTSIQWYDFNNPQTMMLQKATCQKTEFFKRFADPLHIDHKELKEEAHATECMIKPSNVCLNAHDGYIYCMCYTINMPNLEGEALITGSGDGLIKIWSIQENKTIKHIQTLTSGESDNGILCLAISEDGYLFCGVQGGYVQIWDLETNQIIRSVIAHSNDVLSLSVHNSGFVSASADGKIKRWDASFDFIECLDDHQGNILAMTRSKEFLITGSSDQSIKIWDIPFSVSNHKSFIGKSNIERTVSSSEMFLYALETLVSIKTLSNQTKYLEECRRGAKFIKTIIQQLGGKSQLIPGAKGRNPLVYGYFNAIQNQVVAPTVLFYGHYDVVPVNNESEWLNDPFKVSGINGYLYGRGTSDNKGPLITNIFAVHELLKEGLLNVNVVFLIEGEEENGSEGLLEALTAYNRLFQNIDLILLSNSYWLGEDIPCITYGLRGVIHASITISSRLSDLHSGVEGGAVPEPLSELIYVLGKLVDPSHNVLIPDFYRDVLPVTDTEENLYAPIIEWMQSCESTTHCRSPHSCVTSSIQSGSNNISSNGSDDGDNSICDSIADSEEIKRQLMLRWRYPTLSVHNIDVSVDNPTIVSSKATASVSMRIVPNQSIDDICNQFKQHIYTVFDSLKSADNIQVNIQSCADYWLGDPRHPYFEAAAEAIEKEWKVKPLFIREGGSIPAVSWLEKCCNAPVIHIPFGQSSDQAHLPNERIRLHNLHASRRIIKSLLQKIGNKLK